VLNLHWFVYTHFCIFSSSSCCIFDYAELKFYLKQP